MYSPWASKSHSNVFESAAITINYCTYEDFLTGKIPLSTKCMVDEIDSLFFADTPELKGDKFISAILLLNKYQAIGMSATFRGEEGTKWLNRFLKNSNIIQIGAAIPERFLNIDVYGKLNAAQIKEKVLSCAKQKTSKLPVIVILSSIALCEEYAASVNAYEIFGNGTVPEQISLLKDLKKVMVAPWPLIFTTSNASIGHDLTSVAYVI